MRWDLLKNHPINNINVSEGWGAPTEEKDVELLNRICDYFNNRMKTESTSYGSNIWANNVNRQGVIMDALTNKNIDLLDSILRNMFTSSLTNGTMQGDVQYNDFKNNPYLRQEQIKVTYDKLITLLELTGVINMFSPEEFYFNQQFERYYNVSIEQYLEEIMGMYDVDWSAPKYTGGLFGIQTNKGLYGERDFVSMGIATMIADRFPDRNIRICEIGGGAGHQAYYLHRLGYKNIDIVDLPTISVSQMYFLNTNLKSNNILLLAPYEFTDSYDLVINIDSMVEMSQESAIEYCDKMKTNTKNFISINHETNTFRVQDVCKLKRISRHPFWLRRGYVFEEYVNL